MKVAGDLQPADYNPRKITDKQSKMLKRSMDEFGDLSGIVVNIQTGNIVGGNQRHSQMPSDAVITKKPYKDKTGTVAIGHIDINGVRWNYREVDWVLKRELAANVAANKHGGSWDIPGLKAVIADIDDGALDLDLIGFDEEELADLFGNLPVDDEPSGTDESSEPDAKQTRVKAGQLWRLGGHRLFVGDPLLYPGWATLMGGQKAAMSIIDKENMGDADQLLTLVSNNSDDNAGFYIWRAWKDESYLRTAIDRASLEERQQIIWIKESQTFGKEDYASNHEICVYASKKGKTPNFYGSKSEPTVWRVAHNLKKSVSAIIGPGVIVTNGIGEKLLITSRESRNKKYRTIRIDEGQSAILQTKVDGTVWEVERSDAKKYHAKQRPVELAVKAIKNSSCEGDIVLDPFLSSGSTLMAAELTGRECYGFSEDPDMANVILDRWEGATQRQAELVEDPSK